MAVTILFIYKRIVIDKVLITSIVRRIDVNNIYLPCMRIRKGGKRIEVVSLNEHMIRRTRWRSIQTLVGILDENWQFVLHFIPSLFRAFFPYKSIMRSFLNCLQQLMLQVLVDCQFRNLRTQCFQVYFLRNIGVP